ncbi:MAG: response regulator [Rhizobiales bacterium]|nr:response regulator [Hyphomicrobiales bacterium]
MTIRTILVDDEKLAIQGLQLRLQPFEDVEIIDTCANGREAIRKIKTEKPDLVFLDIQMPGFDGFSVVKGVMEIEPPLFVFVTAFDEFAVSAFERAAVDYLLKPATAERLQQTVARLKARLTERTAPPDAGERAGDAVDHHDGAVEPGGRAAIGGRHFRRHEQRGPGLDRSGRCLQG